MKTPKAHTRRSRLAWLDGKAFCIALSLLLAISTGSCGKRPSVPAAETDSELFPKDPAPPNALPRKSSLSLDRQFQKLLQSNAFSSAGPTSQVALAFTSKEIAGESFLSTAEGETVQLNVSLVVEGFPLPKGARLTKTNGWFVEGPQSQSVTNIPVEPVPSAAAQQIPPADALPLKVGLKLDSDFEGLLNQGKIRASHSNDAADYVYIQDGKIIPANATTVVILDNLKLENYTLKAGVELRKAGKYWTKSR